jgi:hypothetical protein
LNHCHKLDSPVYKNVLSYEIVNLDCRFMVSDNCNGEEVIRVDARDTVIWGRIDVDGSNGYEHMIGSVVCFDTKLAAAGSMKRNGPGETTVCENTIDSGHCETLSANNACIAIPTNLSHRVHSIYQAAGSTCNYYDSSCAASTPTISIDSHHQPLSAILDPSVGNRIGWVMCRDRWATNELGEEPASVHTSVHPWHVEASTNRPRANNVGPDSFSDDYDVFSDRRTDTDPSTPGTSDNHQPPSNPHPETTGAAIGSVSTTQIPGDVKISSEESYDGRCKVIQTMGSCYQLSQRNDGMLWYHIRSILQWDGALCLYFSSYMCTEVMFYIDTMDHAMFQDPVEWEFAAHLGSIYCTTYSALVDGIAFAGNSPLYAIKDKILGLTRGTSGALK